MAETLTIVLKADGSGLTGTLSASTGEFRKFGVEVDNAGRQAEAGGRRAEEAGRAAKRGGDSAEAAQKKWEKFGANIGTVIGGLVVGFTALLAKQINVADNTGKMAERLGVGTRFLSEMGYAAKETGANNQILEASLASLAANATKAADGVKAPAQAFRAVGVEVRDAAGRVKSLEVLLPQIADRFARLEDGPRKTAAAMALFGEQGRLLLPMLNAGAAGIDELREKAVELGLSISEDTAVRAAEFNDNLARLKDQSMGLVNHLMQDALPALVKFSSNLVEDGRTATAAGQQYSALGLIINTLATAYYALQHGVERTTYYVAASIEVLVAGVGTAVRTVSSLVSGTGTALKALASGDLKGAADAYAGTVASMASNTAAFTQQAMTSFKQAGDMAADSFGAAQVKIMEQWTDSVDDLTRGTKANAAATEEAGRVYASTAAKQRDKERADREAAQSIKALNDLIRAQQNEYVEPVAKAWNDYQGVLQKIRKEQEDLIRVNRLTAESVALIARAQGEAAKAYARNLQLAEREQLELDRRRDIVSLLVQDYIDETRAIAASAREREIQVALLRAEDQARKNFNQGLRDTISLTAEETRAIREGIDAAYTQREFIEMSRAAAEEYQRNWWSAIDSVSNAFGDWMTGGIRGFEDFTGTLTNIAKRWLADMIATYTRSQLGKVFTGWMNGSSSGNWTSQLGGMLGGSSGGAGGNGGWMSQLAGMIRGGNNLTGTSAMAANSGWMSSAGASAGSMAGFGNNMGNFMSMGSTGAGAAGMSGAAAVPIIGWIIAGMMQNAQLWDEGWDIANSESWAGKFATLGAVSHADDVFRKLGFNNKTASILSGSSIHAKLFGRKAPEITAQGLVGSYGFDSFAGQSYADIKAKGGMFRSDKKWTEYGAVDNEVTQALNGTITRVAAGVTALAEQLGVDLSTQLASVRVDLGKVTLDADPDKAAAQLEGLMNRMVENLVGKGVQFAGFGHLLDKGFAASDVMYGLAAAIELMTGNATDLGRALNAAELQLVDRTVQMFQKMAVAAGNTLEEEISAIAGAASGYGSVVAAAEQDVATAGFSGFAKSLLAIRTEERQRIETLNAQAKALHGLSAREQDLSRVREAAQAKTAALVATLEGELVSLALNRINDQIEQLGGTAAGAGSKIENFINSLRLSDTLSPDTDATKRGTADDLMSTAALAGDVDAFISYAQEFLEVSRRLSASSAAYQADYDRVLSLANQFGGASSLQELYAQRDALQAQQEAAARLERAQRIAQGVSDLAGVNGGDPLEILRNVTGITADALASDLGLSVTELSEYLAAQQTDIGDLADILYDLPSRIAQEMVTILVDREVPLRSSPGGPSGGSNQPAGGLISAPGGNDGEVVTVLRSVAARLDHTLNTIETHVVLR